MMKITYKSANLNKFMSRATHLNTEEIKLLLRLLNVFEELFYGTLGKRENVTVDLELNPGPKTYNGRYYFVTRIKKEKFFKDLMHLVEIGVITPVQQSE